MVDVSGGYKWLGRIYPFFDAPDKSIEVLFYPVPLDTPYIGFPTIFNVRIWQNREFKGRTPLGTDPSFYKKVLGRFAGPAPHAPQGTPDQWLNGFSYADYIAGKLGGNSCCVVTIPQGGLGLGGSWLNHGWIGGLKLGSRFNLGFYWQRGIKIGGAWPATSTAGAFVGGIAMGGEWPAIPPAVVTIWSGGIAVGGAWPAASTAVFTWPGGITMGGAWPAASTAVFTWAGGITMGGAWPAASTAVFTWAGGIAMGGAWPAASTAVFTWAGGIAMGGAWPAASTAVFTWAGGIAMGGAWPATSPAVVTIWAGGIAMGGAWPATSPAVTWAGGLAIGGAWPSGGIVTECCPGLTPRVLTGTVTNVSDPSPPANFGLTWDQAAGYWSQSSPQWILRCERGPYVDALPAHRARGNTDDREL